MENARFKRGIRWKLLMTIVGFVIIISVAFLSLVILPAQEQYLEQILENRISYMKDILIERGTTLARNLARQAANDIESGTVDNVAKLAVDTDVADRLLNYVVITDRQGLVLVHSANPTVNNQVVTDEFNMTAIRQKESMNYEFTKDGVSILEFIEPVNVRKTSWGVLRLGYSMDMLNLEIDSIRAEIDEQKEIVTKKSYATILTFVVLGAILALVESAQFSKPLIKLTESANEMAKGNFAAASTISVHSNDEFGVLADAFVKMSNNLKASYEKLEDYSHTLEDKVERRTRELENLMADVSTMNKKLENIVDKMTEIGVALSTETDFKKLSELIVSHARTITNADAGTLYLLENNALNFLIIQNDTLKMRMGGESGDKIPFPPVELDRSNVSAYVALTGISINVPDVYDSEKFDFTGPKKFDRSTGYRSRSMLVVPMKNDKNEIVGVIQLLNAKAVDADDIIPFSDDAVRLAEAIASQAAVAVSNVRLINEKEKLFEEVLNLKNYDESILESLSNGVISLDASDTIVKCNQASLRILAVAMADLIGQRASDYFSGDLAWISAGIERVRVTGEQELVVDAELKTSSGAVCQVNMTVVPLISVKNEPLGTLLILEDITGEKRLKGTLARYMTKEVAERLVESSEEILGGQIQEAAVLFSDIRQFTTLTERLGAQETVSLLNEYFTIMVDIIFDNDGILDKYIGDAIMAAFGIPFGNDDDTDRSVISAIQMMTALREFNARRVRDNKDEIRMGIGINTDEVLAGNIGSLKRMDYTIIGDGVNLAARLESASKYYSANILISEYSLKKLKGKYVYREVDRIKVKGKNRPVGIYEVLDFHDHHSFPELTGCIELFHEGLTSYRQRQWHGAIAAFDRCIQLNANDRLPNLYIERCRYFLDHPPGNDWTGVWVMKTK